ncbi:MAG: response regulator [Bacteroidales bacterium]|nr:response regulator [Bacteroidales bacterium]
MTTKSYSWIGKKVLIVEDDRVNLMMVKLFLTSTGITILNAMNGDEAIEIFTSEKPDIILMDIRMPGMDGLDATRIIRVSDKSVPIIAVTAFAMPNDEEIALSAGCSAFITKPYNKNFLMQKMNQLLVFE